MGAEAVFGGGWVRGRAGREERGKWAGWRRLGVAVLARTRGRTWVVGERRLRAPATGDNGGRCARKEGVGKKVAGPARQ